MVDRRYSNRAGGQRLTDGVVGGDRYPAPARCQLPVGQGTGRSRSDGDIYIGSEFRIDVSSEAGSRFDQNVTGFRAEKEFGFNAEPYVRTGKFVRVLGLWAGRTRPGARELHQRTTRDPRSSLPQSGVSHQQQSQGQSGPHGQSHRSGIRILLSDTYGLARFTGLEGAFDGGKFPVQVVELDARSSDVAATLSDHGIQIPGHLLAAARAT